MPQNKNAFLRYRVIDQCLNNKLRKFNRERLANKISEKLVFEKKYGILIKRSESYRSILNHDQFLGNLKSYYNDIEWKVFDKLSFNETTELFSKAKVIVAPHGAGLTNMLFSSQNIFSPGSRF